jgi:hypothetical protein
MPKGNKARQKERQKRARQRAEQTKKRQQKSSLPPIKDSPRPANTSKPSSFEGFDDIMKYASQATYLFARLRPNGENTDYKTLGTAFLAGRNRMVTCAHCINTSGTGNPLMEHIDGDSYLFVQKDEFGQGHQSVVTPTLGQDLFLYENMDTAIFYLPDDFYQAGGDWLRNPNNHISLAANFSAIGSDVGVAGYPMQELRIDANGVDVSSFTLRADRGVVNTRYVDGAGVELYEFTMAFNPGNSGGPIFDIKSGNVIGLVHGFQSFQIAEVDATKIFSSYSLGVSSRNLKAMSSEHSLSFE